MVATLARFVHVNMLRRSGANKSAECLNSVDYSGCVRLFKARIWLYLTVICHTHELLHRSFSRTHEYHSVVMSVHMPHQYLSGCRTMKYPHLVKLWYTPGAMPFARLSASCRYTWGDRAQRRYLAGCMYGIISRTLCIWMCHLPCSSITKSMMVDTSLTYRTHAQFLSSIRGAYLSQYYAKKNTNAVQCVGMFEVIHCCFVIKQRHVFL